MSAGWCCSLSGQMFPDPPNLRMSTLTWSARKPHTTRHTAHATTTAVGYKSNSRVVCIHTPAHVKIPHNAFLYVSFCTQNYGGRFLFIWIPFFLSNTMAIISAHAHTRRRVQDGWQISEQYTHANHHTSRWSTPINAAHFQLNSL